MAHEISAVVDAVSGEKRYEAMVAGGKPAWHNPITNIPVLADFPNSQRAMEAAHIGWTVSKRRVKYDAIGGPQDGSILTAADDYCIVRDDTQACLGTVGKRYVPIQNAQAFEFLDQLVEGHEMTYESAGALFGGRRVWVLGRLPDEVQVGSEKHMPFVMFSNRHDGFGSGDAMVLDTRVVCWNTYKLAMSRRDARYMKIRHTGDVKSKLDDARRILGIARSNMLQFATQAEQMADHRMTSDALRAFWNEVFPIAPPPKSAEEATPEASKLRKRNVMIVHSALDRLFAAPETPEADGTLWGAFNAVTHYLDHDKKVTGRSAQVRFERRFQNTILDGPGTEAKDRAWFAALDLIGAGS